MFIAEKYIKIRFKNRVSPCYFLELKRSKILQKLNTRDCSCNMFSLISYGVSRAKTDLRSKYIFNLCLTHFLNKISIKLIYFRSLWAKMTYMCTYFKTENKDHSIRRSLTEKKNMEVQGWFLKKRKLCMQNLTKEWKQLSVVILQQANFYNIFILCLWLRIIRRSNQSV